jgi:hypothetical protein
VLVDTSERHALTQRWGRHCDGRAATKGVTVCSDADVVLKVIVCVGGGTHAHPVDRIHTQHTHTHAHTGTQPHARVSQCAPPCVPSVTLRIAISFSCFVGSACSRATALHSLSCAERERGGGHEFCAHCCGCACVATRGQGHARWASVT